jgi:hypothetical protein
MEAFARRCYQAQAAERKGLMDSGEVFLNTPFERSQLSETHRKGPD